MKARDTEVVQHSGNLASESATRMSFDQNSITFLMNVLTDLYSDPVAAVIREYSTNAWDSHKAAGNPAPIEVTLPSSWNPSFTVRDHGVGLSVDEITDFYSKYGASSKRNTDDQVGLLGLGCKSGLTYTNQFSVTGIKHGVKTVAVVTRDTDGAGLIQVLDTVSTDEPDGVEVSIPVKRIEEFNRRANEFFSFWEAGAVLVDGEAPVSIFDSGLKLDEDIVVLTDSEIETDYIVMGNVPYPVRNNNSRQQLSKKLKYNAYVIARVAIGEVNFTPSREQLHFTDRTKATIETIQNFVDERIIAHAQRELAAAPTPFEALKTRLAWGNVIAKFPVSLYNGKLIPASVQIGGYEWAAQYNHRSGRGFNSKTTYISAEKIVAKDTVIVVGTPKRGFNEIERAAVKAIVPNPGNVFAVSSIADTDLVWIDGANVIDYEQVRPPKVVRPKTVRGPRSKAKYFVFDGMTYKETDDAPTGDIVYILRTDAGHRSGCNRETYRHKAARYIVGRDANVTVVLIGGPEQGRFLKKHPQAVTVVEYLQSRVYDIENVLTQDALDINTVSHPVAGLDPADILDPEVCALIERFRAINAQEELIAKRDAYVRIAYELWTVTLDQKDSDKVAVCELLSTFQAQYPLIANERYEFSADAIEYINATYYFRSTK
jgi:hypothetical protein